MGLRLDPGYELQGAIVEVLRADAVLGALLFQRPAVSPVDRRVYQADVQLPDNATREVLPRVLVAVRELPYETEQSDAVRPLATCIVTVHILVEASQRDLGETIASQVRLALSTATYPSSIIVGELVPESPRQPVREVAFRDAWRLTREYRAQLVGVL